MARRTEGLYLRELARATGGSVLFAFPLLMTMEMWQLGFSVETPRFVLFLLTGFALLVGLSHFAGFEPDIELVLDGIETASGGIAARFTAHNRGTRAAGGVEIEGRLGASTAATTFDFIPGGARRSGTLVFPDSGDRSGIELRVLGYREP